MNRVLWLSVLVPCGLLAAARPAPAQRTPYIGYVYPAGGQQGATVSIRLGGQYLDGVQDAVVSGEGVKARLTRYYRRLGNQEVTLLREQLRELKQKEAQAKKAKGKLNQGDQEIMARIEDRIGQWVNAPACPSHSSLAFVEVSIAPDAKPGFREIRLVTLRGPTNPLPFHISQTPEVARKPMKTCLVQVLGKEYLALRKRPEEEVEAPVSIPCVMNGQVASGEVNRYRFTARKGQRLVIWTAARRLVPYIADAVPGWFQPVLTLYDASGKEVAFDDDYRFHPDPTLYFETPADGEYVLEIRDALYRGREDFVYRITIGELPFVTSIFPLGARVGQPAHIEMRGWNLDGAVLAPPPSNSSPGVYRIAARRGGVFSNSVPFALGTLPERFDQEPNNDPSHAQAVRLPVVVNGRVDQPGDWDLFRVRGRAGDAIVAEVTARRLDSPVDSLLKLTDAAGKVLAMNDDHEDLGSGLITHHADSYFMTKLPADGDYYVQLGDAERHGGVEYGYRLRISAPRPDFALRVMPSALGIRRKGSAAVTVFAFRKDGFAGDIKLSLKDPPAGFLARPVVLPADKPSVRLAVRTNLPRTKGLVPLAIEGRASIQGREVAHVAVPTEDMMQAFLWRHLVPAKELDALVYDPSYQPPPQRTPPPLPAPDKTAAKSASPKFSKRQVAGRLRQLKLLYEEWLLTDDFYNRKVAECQASL